MAAPPADPLARRKTRDLYEQASQRDAGAVFTQQDLSAFGIAETPSELLTICQDLLNGHLFQMMTGDHNETLYKLRSEEEASKLRSMAHDERILYQLIESSTTTGMWTKTLKLKSNLHQSVVTRCLKSLETKSLIKEIRSVKTPKRKIYMLTHFEPSEEVSGGPWHADGELDLELIEHLTHLILEFVRAQSWAEMSPAQYAAWKAQKKAAAAAHQPVERPPLGPHRRPLVPRAPDAPYPTAAQILRHVMDTGIIEGVVLRESDFRALLDMMEWDGLLERMSGSGFRTARAAMVAEAADGAAPGNGLSDAPCGTCPVFNLCEEGGPVNAGNCVYFEEWLRL